MSNKGKEENVDQASREKAGCLWAMPSYVLNRVCHRYNKNVSLKLKEKGLITLDVRIIVALNRLEQLTVNELCVHAIAEQPAMSRALDRLENEGYVSRRVSEEDSRIRLVEPTSKAKNLFEEIFPVMQSANKDMLSALDEDEQEILMNLLTKVLLKYRKHSI